ncbi:unnamed protein product, partial [Brenthis ino]
MRVIILGFSVDIQETSRSSCHMDRLAQRSRSPVEFMRSSAARSPILNRPCPRGVRSPDRRADSISGSRAGVAPDNAANLEAGIFTISVSPAIDKVGHVAINENDYAVVNEVVLAVRHAAGSQEEAFAPRIILVAIVEDYWTMWGLNNTFNKGINRTPAEALFGVRPTGSTESKIIHDLDKNRANIRDEINTHIKACQLNQKESFDKHRCIPPKYNVGDLVRVERQVPATGQSKKLVPKFQGPYRIASILDHDRFAIEDTPLTSKRGRSFSTIVAIDKIKPWLNFNRPHVSGTYSSESDDEESRDK